MFITIMLTNYLNKLKNTVIILFDIDHNNFIYLT